jgi:hypothetical protein
MNEREERKERTVVFNDNHVVLDGESVDELLALDGHRGAGRVLKDGDSVEDGGTVEAVKRVSTRDKRRKKTATEQRRRERRWRKGGKGKGGEARDREGEDGGKEREETTHRFIPPCSSGFQLPRSSSIASGMIPSPSIFRATGRIPEGQAVL